MSNPIGSIKNEKPIINNDRRESNELSKKGLDKSVYSNIL